LYNSAKIATSAPIYNRPSHSCQSRIRTSWLLRAPCANVFDANSLHSSPFYGKHSNNPSEITCEAVYLP